MVFGFSPEPRSASLRKLRSPSPEPAVCALIIAIALLMISGSINLAMLHQLNYHQRIADARPAQEDEMIDVVRQVQLAASLQGSPAPSAVATRRAANTAVKLMMEDLDLEMRGADTKSAYIFVKDSSEWLQPVLSWGPKGYRISANQSIAACTIRHNAAVYWAGSGNRTDSILSWSLDGEFSGRYDDTSKTLKFYNDSCAYFAAPFPDHKDQLLCEPILDAQGNPSAALCLTAEKSDSLLSDPLIRRAVLQKAVLLGLLDLTSLMDAAETPNRSAQAKAPTAGSTN